ncbi:ABC transporter substrate-binding protein [Pueribacillus theae]|nr:ABC transporter substrate-binding protein [Pueribacillus theae]
MRLKWMVPLLVLLVTLVSAGCSSGAKEAEVEKESPKQSTQSSEDETKNPKSGGTYTIVTASDPDMLDPHRSSSIYTHGYMGLVYNKLLTYETGPDIDYTDYNIVGDLAEKWEVSDDGKVYTFHLRDANFHNIPPVNGRKLVAEDVVATMERMMTLPGHQASLLAEVESVEAKDEKTVVFTLKQPLTPFLNFIANHFMWILPKEAIDGDFDVTTTAIGTGPFMLEKWEDNIGATFVRNPDFYEEGKPYIEKVEYLVIPDVSAQIAAFRTGKADVISQISPEEIDNLLKTNPDTVINEVMIPTQIQVAMNMDRDPFKDVRVRKAISMAIDRQNAVDQIFGGGEVSSPVNPSLGDWALPKEEREKLQPFDQEKAKQLLAEAGFPDGFDTTIMVTDGYGQQPVRIAQWVAEDLRAIGINADFQVTEYATFYTEKYPKKDYDMVVTYQTFFQEADEWLRTQLRTGSPRNWFGVSDPELDKMLDEQRVMLDENERKAKVHDIQRYLLEEIVNPIPLVTNYVYSPRHPHVKNYHPHASYGNIHMKNVWLDK